MNIYSIYTLTNLVNGKIYIGKTVTNPYIRYQAHIRSSQSDSKQAIHNAIRLYGVDNFKFKVIFNTFKKEDLDHYERFFISEYQSCVHDSTSHGYNMTRGGDGIDSETARIIAKQQIKEGRHNFQNDDGTYKSGERARQLVASKQHHFQMIKGTDKSKEYVAKGIATKMDRGYILSPEVKAKLKIDRQTQSKINRSNRALASVKSGTCNFLKPEVRAKAKETMRNKPKETCPHCGLTGKGPNMTRYHNNNCKMKN